MAIRDTEDVDFERLLIFLKQTRGFDFTAYKRTTVQRRVQKRMQMKHIEGYPEYIEYLEVHPDEFQHLFNTILINVTSFFRDPEEWDYLRDKILPQILSSKGPDDQIRVWSAGCASGEEAYTLAVLLCERMGPDEFRHKVKIYATDVDEDALAHSRSARYAQNETENVPPEYVQRYFEESNGKMVFSPDLRRGVIFGRHDLIQDAPISRVDLLLCRNTLMYFNAEAQERILARFSFALNDNGFLFLGKAETLLSHYTLFTPVDPKRRIFTKVLLGNRKGRVAGTNNGNAENTEAAEVQTRLREAILDSEADAQIVIDAAGNLFLANHKARTLFGITAADIGRPIQDLEISYRPVELRSGIDQAIALKRIVETKDVPWENNFGEIISFDIKISPVFDERARLLGVSVIWEDVTHFKRLQDELVNFNQELETAYEELQSTNEELQTTNEELQSTVEELETTNEELQSTNEELETMNEELQSTNEELETINDELRQRSADLNETNAFLNAILAGFNEGVFVIDNELQVLAWNPKSEDLWGLRSEEVVGKHLLNLDIGLPTDQIRPVVKSVLSGEESEGAIMLQATNRRGKKLMLTINVTALPAASGQCRGAIVTVDDSTQAS